MQLYRYFVRSFTAITLCVASEQVFIVVYFVIDSVRKLVSHTLATCSTLNFIIIIVLGKIYIEIIKFPVMLNPKLLNSSLLGANVFKNTLLFLLMYSSGLMLLLFP
jgi:hypothetical protein